MLNILDRLTYVNDNQRPAITTLFLRVRDGELFAREAILHNTTILVHDGAEGFPAGSFRVFGRAIFIEASFEDVAIRVDGFSRATDSVSNSQVTVAGQFAAINSRISPDLGSWDQ